MRNIFILLICFTATFSQNIIRQTDISFSASLEGKNHSVFVNYVMEGLALSTPFIEFGYAGLYQLESDIIHPLTVSIVGVQLPIAIGKYILNESAQIENISHAYGIFAGRRPFLPDMQPPPLLGPTTFALNAPHKQPIMIGYTMIAGYSQIYVGNHYISDILAGWILGWATARIFHYSSESNQYKPLNTLFLRISIPLK